jgi:hypothetical protein
MTADGDHPNAGRSSSGEGHVDSTAPTRLLLRG